jgi:hypothetical protein
MKKKTKCKEPDVLDMFEEQNREKEEAARAAKDVAKDVITDRPKERKARPVQLSLFVDYSGK